MSSSLSRHPYAIDSKSNNIKKLSHCSRAELHDIRERNSQMLSNQYVIDTLPDKGARLRETNQVIDSLLLKVYDEITPDNTNNMECPLTDKLQSMSVLTPHQGARKRSVDLANQQAFNHYSSSGLLLGYSRKKPSAHTPNNTCPSIFFSQHAHHTNGAPQDNQTSHIPHHAKVRMLTLDESLSLQSEQRSSVKECEKALDFAHPSKSLLKSLNLSVDLIQQEINIDDVEFPTHYEESEEEEEKDVVVEPMLID